MGIWEWVTAGLAIWGAVSILVGVFWALAGKRIFRKPPAPPQMRKREAEGILEIARLDAELRGRGDR